MPDQKEALLTSCLLSMKQNAHILMEFLPYILLHVVIEGEMSEFTKAHKEISTVANVCYYERETDENLFSVSRTLNELNWVKKIQKNVNCFVGETFANEKRERR